MIVTDKRKSIKRRTLSHDYGLDNLCVHCSSVRELTCSILRLTSHFLLTFTEPNLGKRQRMTYLHVQTNINGTARRSLIILSELVETLWNRKLLMIQRYEWLLHLAQKQQTGDESIVWGKMLKSGLQDRKHPNALNLPISEETNSGGHMRRLQT